MAHHVEHLGQSLLQAVAEVLAHQVFLEFMLMGIGPLADGLRDIADVGRVADIGAGQVAQLLELLEHGRDDEPSDASHHANDDDEGHDDA